MPSSYIYVDKYGKKVGELLATMPDCNTSPETLRVSYRSTLPASNSNLPPIIRCQAGDAEGSAKLIPGCLSTYKIEVVGSAGDVQDVIRRIEVELGGKQIGFGLNLPDVKGFLGRLSYIGRWLFKGVTGQP